MLARTCTHVSADTAHMHTDTQTRRHTQAMVIFSSSRYTNKPNPLLGLQATLLGVSEGDSAPQHEAETLHDPQIRCILGGQGLPERLAWGFAQMCYWTGTRHLLPIT